MRFLEYIYNLATKKIMMKYLPTIMKGESLAFFASLPPSSPGCSKNDLLAMLMCYLIVYLFETDLHFVLGIFRLFFRVIIILYV